MHQTLAASAEPSIDQLISDVEREGTSAPAANQLLRALHDELHELAERELRSGGGEFTLDATTSLHEAYLNISQRGGVRFPDRARFMGYAARAMRHVVIDCARRSPARKRGGGAFDIRLDDDIAVAPNAGDRARELERLSAALDDLAKLDSMLICISSVATRSGRSPRCAACRGVQSIATGGRPGSSAPRPHQDAP